MKKIIFIGAGNISTNLAINLAKNNYQIIQIFSKSLVNAKILADKVNANATNDLFVKRDNNLNLYIPK